jgi:1-pyrroline-5-carboxylate dehydrogenase
MLPPYTYERFTDFSDPAEREKFAKALEKVRSQLGETFPLVIGDQRIQMNETFASVNPSKPEEVIANFSEGNAKHVDEAIQVATQAFKSWSQTPVEERARYLLKVAAEIRRRKHEFSAMMVLEVGKSWAEADADTAETIDFLEYYARQAVRIADSSDTLAHYEPEQVQLHYIALGVGAIIPPWNFPCAIATGMMAAAIVTGNTVLWKPAEQSPFVAWKVGELFWEQGLPAGVLNFLTGDGEIIGSRMVEHPQTRFIAFTGSRQVGVSIYEKAAKVHAGQKWLKRSILEMGGKDAVIVDETADLDEAAAAIVASAFGFQGQKCSAGSRAIIVDDVYDAIKERVIKLTQKLKVGNPENGAEVFMGPVIDTDSLEKVLSYIEIGKEEGELLTGGDRIDQNGGYFIQPTVFGDISRHARLAQDEIFGPVLALIRADNFDDALDIANDTEYGLTGALFTKNRARFERARREYHVGNLYLNRKCTGALVGVHPFGGFNMSGTDSKAGGAEYLYLFSQAKTIAEKL